MKKILSLKHWQLFLIIFLTAFWTSPSPLKEIINSIAFITLCIWIHAVGKYGQAKLTSIEQPRLNPKIFNYNTIIMPIVWVIIIVFAPEEGAENNFSLKTILFIILGLYLLYAIFQTVFFACKTLTSIELKKDAHFGDYATNLFLFAFFLIGIWILQPKINKLIANQGGQD